VRVRSPAHDFENERNPREDRRLATRLWLQTATVSVTASPATAARSRALAALAALGFGPLDALHLAFAEASAARWFVTTDDRLLKVATGNRDQVRVDVVLPDQLPLETGRGPA
jgi:predicted nucleic acid-binding protein